MSRNRISSSDALRFRKRALKLFSYVRVTAVIGAQMFTSEHLKINEVYTRSQLRDKFDVKDATINNGIFRPKGHDSIWLFVTEEKTKDRTQYSDEFDGDDLYWGIRS